MMMSTLVMGGALLTLVQAGSSPPSFHFPQRNYGTLEGGYVTIYGANLSNPTSVTFGGQTAPVLANATGLIQAPKGLIIVKVPPAKQPGAVDVTISSPQGNTTLRRGWTYLARPAPRPNTLQINDFTYLGSFRPPQTPDFQFTSTGIGFNPAGNDGKGSLFISASVAEKSQSHPRVAEISIPTPVNSKAVGNLPVAVLQQPIGDPSGGLITRVNASGARWGGFYVDVAAGRLYWTVYGYYDVSNSQKVCMGYSSLQMTSPHGLFTLGSLPKGVQQGVLAGSIADIPANWQASFGGYTNYCGQGGLVGINRTSGGPAMVAFDRTALGPTPAPSKTYLWYPASNPGLAANEDQCWVSTYFGTAFIDTGFKRGIICVGSQPGRLSDDNFPGPTWYGLASKVPASNPSAVHNPPDLAWSDPCSISEGTHALAGRCPTLYVIDPADLLESQGSPSWRFVPFEYPLANTKPPNHWLQMTCASADGCAYDSANNILYVLQTASRSTPNWYLLIHVYRLPAAKS